MKLAIPVGVTAGAAFFLHAMLPNSHAWPLIWPLIGGVAVDFLAGRRRELTGFGDGLRLAGATGLVAGAFFFVATASTLYALGTEQFASLTRVLGGQGPITFTALTVKAVAVAAVASVLLVTVAGSVAFPLARHGRLPA
jgi:hypothetical protein